MVIVSQDKTHILNFDNVQDVRIEPYGTHIKGKKIYKIFAGNFEGYTTELGTYDKEETAKEVLQEIVTCYTGDGELYNQGYVVYEMPEDKED